MSEVTPIPPETANIQILEHHDEPTVRDVDLGARLGLKRPDKVRQTIERNRAELVAFGPLASVGTMVKIGSSARREVVEYHLTEEQALAVCALSRGPKAAKVRAELIRVFLAYRRGQLLPELDRAAVGGIVKGIINKQNSEHILPAITSLASAVSTVVAKVEEMQLLTDNRRAVSERISSLELLEEYGANPHGRRGLSVRISNRLRRRSMETGVPARRCPHIKRWLFDIDMAHQYMREEGAWLVYQHNSKVLGQGVIPFRRKAQEGAA